MNQTANYQLKKWDKQDRILMQDFNDNSDAIDAALGEALKGPRVLRVVTLESQSAVMDLSLADIDWSAWSMVGVEIPYRPSDSDATDLSAHPNLGELAYTTNGRLGLMRTAANPFVLVLLPMRDPERIVSAFTLAGTCGYGFAHSVYFKDLTSLRIIYNSNTYHYPIGQKITIWGVK